MFAKERCSATDVWWRGAHLDRRPERPHRPERRMIHFDHQLTREHLRIVEHLRVVIDRTARNVVRVEDRQPVAARPGARD